MMAVSIARIMAVQHYALLAPSSPAGVASDLYVISTIALSGSYQVPLHLMLLRKTTMVS
jgi:hypothetical protein